ncbi:TetR family transcriptional regulator [Herbiconiux sp. CPCC 203407]|uniref:TetR family transcriptional regulator n=1 Tax=Herbiconiux oxytropis TaxID=2970915 RepID=A0AA41XAN6_9MICO|nr:TetR family transcriptional regulator [Herbiconiux oxytropis]MCS5721470.1 TetR family transcriptional regulator [Herbiconiux oxytropis]MCS5724547.1 TetR family transcriptional regulator [Herbiconiux oxytropis]
MESTRDRILASVTAMMRDGADRLSVRAVAAHAGVGASTLRHYFPTQRDLINAALTATYDAAMPDERIRDTSVPPRERLRECLWRLFEPLGTTDADSFEVWQSIFRAFPGPDTTPDARAGYDVIVAQAERRVGAWLAILEAEGALAPGDTARRTHLLLTVVDGLSIERALPHRAAYLEDQAATLAFAVDAVFDLPATARPAR